MKNEAHISSEQSQTQENSWIQSTHENCRGPQSAQPSSPCRPKISHRLTFPKHLKLRTRSEFKRVSKQGQRLVGQSICIDWRSTSCPETRLGLTVSARYGAAHERNLFKRRIREAFRISRSQLPPSLDRNILPRQWAKKATYAHLRDEMIRLLGKIGPLA